MIKKILFILIIVVVASVGGWIYFNSQWITEPAKPESSQPVPTKREYVPEVEAVLQQKTKLLENFAKNPLIITQVKMSNEKDKNLSQAEIEQLDQKWQKTKEVDDFIRLFLTNTVAKELIEFQEINPFFTEIFVTNNRGLNVGQTNKTSDYLQSDEEWWIKAYNMGKGESLHGQIEYDESSQTEAISIYVPILDIGTKQALGVIKAVLDINAIKSGL